MPRKAAVAMPTTLNPRTGKQETMSETLNGAAKDNERLLRQKMAASVVGSAPSLIPAPRVKQGEVPALPEPEPIIPPIDELIPDGEDKQALRLLIGMSIDLNLKIKPLEKQQDAIKDRIKVALSSYGITSMSCDGAEVSYTVTERRNLNHMKLIAAGVDTEVIVACTDITKSSMLKITPARGRRLVEYVANLKDRTNEP